MRERSLALASEKSKEKGQGSDMLQSERGGKMRVVRNVSMFHGFRSEVS